MKKILAVLILLTLILSLFACGGKTPNGSQTESKSGTSSEVSGIDESSEQVDSESAANQSDKGDSKTDNNSNNKASSSKGNTTSNNTSSKSTPPQLADDKVVDMGRYTFTFGSAWLPAKLGNNSTLFERLFFERKAEVEKAYNCTIKIINVYANPQSLQPLIMAKKKVADVIEMMPSMLLPNSQAGYIVPWNDIKNINPNDARWIEAYTKLGTFDGKIWGLQHMRPPEVRGCIFFNKTLLKANGVSPDSLYSLVNNKKWTFDKLREYAIATTKDTNKDGKIDTFGIVGDPGLVGSSLVTANGGRMVSMQNGKAVASYNSQSVLNAVNFYNSLVNTDKVFYTVNGMWSQETWNSHNTDYGNIFLDNKAAFYITESYEGNQRIKPGAKNFEYGMLPLPIGLNASDYVSPSMNARLCAITSTAAASKDIDKIVTIFNALARPLKGYEGEEWWLDEVQADYFQSKDTNSIKMYQLCLNKAMVDLGCGVEQLNFDFLHKSVFDTVFWKSQTPAAALEGMKGQYNDAINAVYNKK